MNTFSIVFKIMQTVSCFALASGKQAGGIGIFASNAFNSSKLSGEKRGNSLRKVKKYLD